MTPAAKNLLESLDDPSRIWLASATSVATIDSLRRRFMAASCFVYEPAIAPDSEPAWLYRGASTAELVRVALALCAMERTPDPRALARAWYRAADDDGKRAMLRALPLTHRPEQHAHLAAIASRSSVAPVFEAIACENPYPARYFGDAAFSQLVLKADFMGLDIARIIGVGRWHAEQRRSGTFAVVRRAA